MSVVLIYTLKAMGILISIVLGCLLFAMFLSNVPIVNKTLRLRRMPSAYSHDRLIRLAREGNCVFLGEGWSFWLSYRKLPSNKKVISMTESYAGVIRMSGTSATVRTGTKIGELQRILSLKGMTFKDRSQFDDMTVGGALKCGGHGFSTSQWMCETVLDFTCVKIGSGHASTGKPERYIRGEPQFFQTMFQKDVLLLEVTLSIQKDVLVDSHNVEIGQFWKTVDLNPAFIPAEYFKSGYRMVFVDASLINFRYLTPVGRDSSLRMPLRFQLVRQKLGCLRNYSSRIRLSQGHAFIKTLDFIEALSMRGLGFINIELFARKSCSLFHIISKLHLFHKKYGGRTEIRERGCFLYAFDLATRGGEKFDAYFLKYLTLLQKVGVREASVHQGKFIPLSLSPLKMTSIETMFSSV